VSFGEMVFWALMVPWAAIWYVAAKRG